MPTGHRPYLADLKPAMLNQPRFLILAITPQTLDDRIPQCLARWQFHFLPPAAFWQRTAGT
jgi:hypothetical protein